MCILRVRRVVQDDDYTTLEVSQSWVFCDRSNGREPCPNTESREQLIRVPNGSALSSPGLMPHDTASSTVSSAPGTPTSGPRFDIRQPFKSTPAASGGNPLRFGHYVATPSLIGRRSSRQNAPRPIISQPDPPVSRGRLNRVPLPTGIRDHRRVHSDSEYEERAPPTTPTGRNHSAATNSTDRATEILDRSAARERARREQVERNRYLEEIRRRQEERDEREERETALDEEEMRTQRRMDHRQLLREEARLRQLEQDRLRDRLPRQGQGRREAEAERRREAEAERRREADRLNLERLRREIEQDKDAERRRLEKEEEEERCRRQLDELLDEERRRKARRAQLERELADYQRLEAQLDHAERRRTEEEAYSRHVQEAEAARRAREIRRAENARLQRERQTELEEELQRLRILEHRVENFKRMRPPMYPHPPTPPRNPSYVQRPIDAPRPPPNITQGHTPNLESFLRQNPARILDENIRRAHGENVLDRARQSAEQNESAEYRIPLGRRNTIGGRDRARETQYRTMRRYPS